MELLKYLSLLLFALVLFPKNETECNSFHPLSYASNHFFVIDRRPASAIRSDLQKVVKNFLAIHVRNLLNHIPDMHLRRNGTGHSEYVHSIKEQIDTLLEMADNKRKLARRIQDSYDQATERNGSESAGSKRSEQKSKLLRQNLNEISNLLRRAEELEEKAQQLHAHLDELKNWTNSKKELCDIHKSGRLGYVSSRNGLKHTLNNVKAEIDNEGLTLFDKDEHKVVYTWHLMQIPFKVIGHVNQCFYFIYKNQQPMFCAGSVVEAHAWINALTEGYLCSNLEIKGTVVNRNMDVHTLRVDEKEPTVEIYPEDSGSGTRIILDQVEHHMEDNELIDINALKNQLENERKELKLSE